MLSFQEWNWTKKNKSFRRFLTNQSLIFEIWPQLHCTTQGLIVMKQYKQDEPEPLWLHTWYNEVQRSLTPMKMS